MSEWKKVDTKGRGEVEVIALGDMKAGIYPKGKGWAPYPDMPTTPVSKEKAKAMCLDHLEKRLRGALSEIVTQRRRLEVRAVDV